MNRATMTCKRRELLGLGLPTRDMSNREVKIAWRLLYLHGALVNQPNVLGRGSSARLARENKNG